MKKAACLLFIIGSTVLVSFQGKAVSYLLFYFSLLLPLLALLYSLYVYFRFKIVQNVEHLVVKGQKVPYQLILGNEDFLPFTDITLHFYTDMVTMQYNSTDPEPEHLCLLPHDQKQIETKMYCRHRGTYPVGVKSVTVTDFLGLFTITYPMMSQVRLTAKPRILPLERLSLALKKKDPKNTLFPTTRLQNLPDHQVRRYQSGDPRKYIHWKNSARTGELLVRKQMPEELFETVLLLDLSPIRGDSEMRLQAEDNILEAALSYMRDCCLKNIPVRVVYMDTEIRELLIDVCTGFDAFYEKCADISFESLLPLEKVWGRYASRLAGTRAYILITSSQSPELTRTIEESRILGNEVLCINAGELSL